MTCPHCKNDDGKLIEDITTGTDTKHLDRRVYLCYVCMKTFKEDKRGNS